MIILVMSQQYVMQVRLDRQFLQGIVAHVSSSRLHTVAARHVNLNESGVTRYLQHLGQIMHMGLPAIGWRLKSVMHMEAMKLDARATAVQGSMHRQHGGIGAATKPDHNATRRQTGRA